MIRRLRGPLSLILLSLALTGAPTEFVFAGDGCAASALRGLLASASKSPTSSASAFLQPARPYTVARPYDGSRFPPSVRATEYDVQMARAANLQVDEVIALRTNFMRNGDGDLPGLPETGELGLIRRGDDLVLDPDANLVGAYRGITARLQTGQPLTADDIVTLRTNAYSQRSNGGTVVEIPTRYKDQFTARLEVEIPSQVQDRLRHYGIPFEIEDGRTIIRYPGAARGPPSLEKFTDDLNRMIAEGQPPERIASFAVQDLLILHPFNDGNGRTARLLGQAIYRRLTGRDIVFPPSFHREMNASLDDLAAQLVPRGNVSPRISDTPSLQELGQATFAGSGRWIDTPTADTIERITSQGTRRNRPGRTGVLSENSRRDGEFPVNVINGSRPTAYRELPEDVRRFSGTVYRGEASPTLEAAERNAMTGLRFGRSAPRDGEPTFNLGQHVGSPSIATRRQRGPTGLVSTSSSYNTAYTFGSSATNRAGRPGYTVVYVIDARGADVVNLNRLNDSAGFNHVVFPHRVPPSRIQAAVIVDNTTRRPVRVIRNPDFQVRTEGE